MKYTLRFFLGIVALAAFAACAKEIDVVPDAPANVFPPDIISAEGHLVSSTLIGTKSVDEAYDEFIDYVNSSPLKDVEEVTSIEEKPNLLAALIGVISTDEFDRSKLPSLGLDIKTWRISYNTKGGLEGKEDVVLSADVSFVTDRLGLLYRRLESVSLFNAAFNAAEGDIAYYRDIVLSFRAIHNALVVIPFYQGTYVDRGNHVVTPGDYLLKARQAIDAELAAIELVKSLGCSEKVWLAKNYYTENMGLSNGGGVSLAVQYLLEADEKLMPLNETIRLAGTYVGEGCCSLSKILPHILEDAPCPDAQGSEMLDISVVKGAAYVASVFGTYCTWFNKDHEFVKGHVNSYYFKKEFISRKLVDFYNPYYADVTYCDAFLNGNLYWGIFGDFIDVPITDVVNPNLIKEDGTIDVTPLVELLYINNEQKILSGWTPKSHLHFKHSVIDEFIPFSHNYELYETLSNNGSNSYVSFEPTYRYGHIMSSVYQLLFDIAIKKHPCPLHNCCK